MCVCMCVCGRRVWIQWLIMYKHGLPVKITSLAIAMLMIIRTWLRQSQSSLSVLLRRKFEMSTSGNTVTHHKGIKTQCGAKGKIMKKKTNLSE